MEDILNKWRAFFDGRLATEKSEVSSLLVQGGIRHVVFLCPYAARTGGVPTFQRDVIETLLRSNAGLTVDLLYLRAGIDRLETPFQDQRRGNRLILHGLPDRWLPEAGTSRSVDQLADLVREELERLHEASSIDLIAMNSSTPHFEVFDAALDFAEDRGIATHYYFHGGVILDGTLHVIRRSDAAVTNSEALKLTFDGLGTSISVVRPVGDLSFFLELLSGEERLKSERLKEQFALNGKDIILHASRLAPRKGQEETILAAKDLQTRYPSLADKAVFVILGPARDPGEDERLRSLVKSNGVRIVFVAEQEREQMKLWYHASDIALYPTRAQEPFGLVPIEAQACGVPVIVTLSGGLPETLQENVTGLVVERQNPTALAEAIAFLLHEPEQRRRMGRQAADYIRTRYSLDRTTEDLSRSYLTAFRSTRTRQERRRTSPPEEPLRVQNDGYNEIQRPGDVIRMGIEPVAANTWDDEGPADGRYRIGRIVEEWLQTCRRFMREVAPTWLPVTDSEGTYAINLDSLVVYDAANLPSRHVGPFRGVILPPLPERGTWSVTREQAAATPGPYDLAKIYPKQIIIDDPKDHGLVLQINPWPKLAFHSLLISKRWQPHRLTIPAALSQLRWVREGAVSEFHRADKFIDHLHIHLHAPDLAPIARFADRFVPSDQEEEALFIGRLAYPLPNVTLASADSLELAQATVQFAELLEDHGCWYQQAALMEKAGKRALSVFVLFKPVTRLNVDVTPIGIIKLMSLREADEKIWKRIHQATLHENSLAPLRKEFMLLRRSALRSVATAPVRKMV